MSLNFFSFPSEVRNAIYELVLLNDNPIDPCVNYYRRQKLTPEIFRATKAAHREAISFFYARNCFDFTSRIPEDIILFFNRIGQDNASHIRHIYIDFPTLLYLDGSDVTLEEDSDRILGKIQCSCPNLETLKTSLYSTNAMELRLDAQDTPKIFSEAMKLVDNRFRASPSLQEIIVEAYEDGPCDQIRREMKRCGWKLSLAEGAEEAAYDRFYSDFDSFYCRYSIDDDEYDIDNDSDFWRRACD
jgi:hypothetical protein